MFFVRIWGKNNNTRANQILASNRTYVEKTEMAIDLQICHLANTPPNSVKKKLTGWWDDVLMFWQTLPRSIFNDIVWCLRGHKMPPLTLHYVRSNNKSIISLSIVLRAWTILLNIQHNMRRICLVQIIFLNPFQIPVGATKSDTTILGG